MLLSMDIYKAKQEFLEHLEIERGLSLNTVKNYDRYLTRFIEFSDLETIYDINENSVKKFRLELHRSEKKALLNSEPVRIKKNTQNYYLISIRSFLTFLMKLKKIVLAPSQITLAKTGSRQIDLLSEKELERFLTPPEDRTLINIRDQAIIETLFSTGLRVAELVSLPRSIDLTLDEISVRGKGDKVRVIFLSPRAKEAIAEYLLARKDLEEPLFVSTGVKAKATLLKGGSIRLTPRTIQRIVRSRAIRAGIQSKVTPHVLRHSFATNLLRKGADIRSVQAMLGHANITTTQVYTHVTDRHLLSIHKEFHGLASSSENLSPELEDSE